jgi:hypothetical protein
MAKLKYQQGFLKHELPFTYHGEANADTFKKWVREVREWKLDSRPVKAYTWLETAGTPIAYTQTKY